MNRTDLIQRLMENFGSFARHAHQGMPGERPHSMPTRAQLGVMFMLSKHPSLSIKELAEQFGISSSATTQLVSAMVDEGLLTRTEDALDRRLVRIDLTPKGKKQLMLAREARATHMKHLFEPLSDSELAELLRLQQKMSSALPNKHG
jgi:DNA-binding MarR family transcriptional regulator